MAIGIDVGDVEKYKISFQVSTTHSSSDLSNSGGGGSSGGSSSNGPSKSGSPSFIVNTVECDSIDTGINLINSYLDKTIDLSHCKILLVSDTIAKEGISSIIYTLVNKVEIRPDCNIIISQIPKDEFPDNKNPSIQDLLSKFYDITTNTENKSGYTENVTLSKFYSALKNPSVEPFAALGIVRNPKKASIKEKNNNFIGIDKSAKNINSTDDSPIVEILGLSVFKDDKLVGTLSGIETVCHLILTNKLNNCIFTIPRFAWS